MSTINHCDAILDAADHLTDDEQKTLIDVLRHRLAEKNHRQITRDIEESKREFAEGQCRTATPRQCLDELLQ